MAEFKVPKTFSDNINRYFPNNTSTSYTRKTADGKTTDAIKIALKFERSPLTKFKREAFNYKHTREKKEDLNTFECLHEINPFYDIRLETGTLSTLFDNLTDLVNNDIVAEEDGEAVDVFASINNDIAYTPNSSDISTIINYSLLYNDFLIVPYYDEFEKLRLNTIHGDKFVVTDTNEITIIDMVTEDRVLATRHTLVEQKAYVEFIEYVPNKFKVGEWVERIYAQEEYNYKLFPFAIQDNDKVINDAIKRISLSRSELATMADKEVLVNTALLQLNQDVMLSGTFDMYNNAMIQVNKKSVDPTQIDQSEPAKVISGNMRFDQFNIKDKAYLDELATLVKIDATSLGLAPGNVAVEREQRTLAKRINRLQDNVNNILDFIIKQFTQKENVVLKLMPMSEQTEAQRIESEKTKLTIGASSEYLTTKKLNPDLTDDEIWEIVLTSLIRNGKVLTNIEEAKAVELNLMSESTQFEGDY